MYLSIGQVTAGNDDRQQPALHTTLVFLPMRAYENVIRSPLTALVLNRGTNNAQGILR